MIFLFFNVFVSKNMNIANTLFALLIFLILIIVMYKFRKPHNRGMSDVILLTGSMCLLLMTAFYFCGFITGFDVNYNVLYRRYILPQTWIITFLIVITSEITRYCVYSIEDRGEKKYLVTKILMFICLILVDLSIATKTYDLSSFNQFYEFFALVLVTSVSKIFSSIISVNVMGIIHV